MVPIKIVSHVLDRYHAPVKTIVQSHQQTLGRIVDNREVENSTSKTYNQEEFSTNNLPNGSEHQGRS